MQIKISDQWLSINKSILIYLWNWTHFFAKGWTYLLSQVVLVTEGPLIRSHLPHELRQLSNIHIGLREHWSSSAHSSHSESESCSFLQQENNSVTEQVRSLYLVLKASDYIKEPVYVIWMQSIQKLSWLTISFLFHIREPTRWNWKVSTSLLAKQLIQRILKFLCRWGTYLHITVGMGGISG